MAMTTDLRFPLWSPIFMASRYRNFVSLHIFPPLLWWFPSPWSSSARWSIPRSLHWLLSLRGRLAKPCLALRCSSPFLQARRCSVWPCASRWAWLLHCLVPHFLPLLQSYPLDFTVLPASAAPQSAQSPARGPPFCYYCPSSWTFYYKSNKISWTYHYSSILPYLWPSPCSSTSLTKPSRFPLSL